MVERSCRLFVLLVLIACVLIIFLLQWQKISLISHQAIARFLDSKCQFFNDFEAKNKVTHFAGIVSPCGTATIPRRVPLKKSVATPSDETNLDPTAKLALLNKYMTPSLICPEKARVGSAGDGGKWTCNPWKAARNNCVVYSLGIRGDVSFEQDFYERSGYRCRIYSFDADDQPEYLFKSFNGQFLRTRIAAESDESRNKKSLFDIMHSFNHSKIEILKMDIEESEFEVLNSLYKSVEITPTKTPFCQLLVEFHAFNNPEKKVDVWLPMFETMDELGFRLFSKERNVECCDEFSFLHDSCMSQYGLYGFARTRMIA